MAKRPSLKDKILTPEKIEAAYQFLNKKAEAKPKPSAEAAPKTVEEATNIAAQTKPTRKKPVKTIKKATKKSTKDIEPYAVDAKVRVTVDMPAQLHEDMKIMTIRRRQTIRQFILTLIEKEVAKGS